MAKIGEWISIRRIKANSNLYDRYWDAASGAAVVYRRDRDIFGFANGVAWGPFAIPVGSNAQTARIRPESGQWWVYAYCDPNDQEREDWKMAVLDL